MSRRRKIGWFSGVVKAAALIWIFISLDLLLLLLELNSVDGADNNNINTNSNRPDFLHYQYHHVTDETSSQWCSREKVAGDSVNPQIVHLKEPNVDSKCDLFYMLVSTIDGRVSALDLNRKGSLVWSVQADARPLYSSSLASMEMIHNGKKMRLIPSLDGALYQFDGEKVEAVPLSAESLLSSTYKLSDDSMIVGSKDMRNFGVDLHTGEINFACGSEGCSNSVGKSEDNPLDESNLLILTRSTHVVRSVDIKNGNEKWNFSVGQHQIRLQPSARPSEIDDDEDINVPHFTTASDECFKDEARLNDYENLLRLLVPEGRIVALSKRDSSKVSWEHTFESPIAKAWLLRRDKLEAMNLFDGHHIPSLNTYTPDDAENDSGPQPLLYIGSHQKLLYIQASPQFESVLRTFSNRRIGHFIDPSIKVSWRPYLNTASARTPIFGGNRPQITRVPRSTDLRNSKERRSLTVWHEDYPFDTGYYLYPEFRDTRSPLRRNVMLIEDFSSTRELDKSWIRVYPTLYWKEIIFISVVTSVIVQILLRKFLNPRKFPGSKLLDTCTIDTSTRKDSSHDVMVTSDSTSLLADRMSSSGEYVSRFATDFDCLHCLGKGGFGVVFEAINRVDDQHYAIKRIMLPQSEGAKEKVLREVKALAKLEHMGIVRYFNAWVESPPTDWQEERDKQFHFSDNSGPTSFSNMAFHLGQRYQEQNQCVQNSECTERKNKNKMDAQNTYPLNLGTGLEPRLETDSLTVSSHLTTGVHLLKQSASEEFSVHSNLSETYDGSETDFPNSHQNAFTSGVNTNTKSSDLTSDSNTDSKSSIPFSNYSFSSSALFSQFANYADKELSGDSVVFESTSNKQSCDNVTCEDAICSSDNVFKYNLVHGDSHTEGKRQCLSKNDQHIQTVDFSLSSHKNENEDDQTEDNLADPGALSRTKFFLYIQMQLYRKETLKDWLSSNTLNRDRHTVLDIFDQIVCAVDYVHSQGLMHRDLKPSNIFFTADEVVKVGDFGLVTAALNVQQDQECETGQKSPGRHTAEVGTTLYMSPEQIARRPYDLKVDIFSLGLIFLELLIPFSTQMERIRTLHEAKKQVFPIRFNRELPLESKLVHEMTNTDADKRPVTKEILDHPLLLEFAPTRMGTSLRKRTISNNSIG